MQIATLVLAGGAFACSAGALLVMVQVRKDVLSAKAEVDREVDDLKSRVNKFTGRIRESLSQLEF